MLDGQFQQAQAALAPHAQIWGRSAMPWLRDLAAVPAREAGYASALMAAAPESRS